MVEFDAGPYYRVSTEAINRHAGRRVFPIERGKLSSLQWETTHPLSRAQTLKIQKSRKIHETYLTATVLSVMTNNQKGSASWSQRYDGWDPTVARQVRERRAALGRTLADTYSMLRDSTPPPQGSFLRMVRQAQLAAQMIRSLAVREPGYEEVPTYTSIEDLDDSTQYVTAEPGTQPLVQYDDTTTDTSSSGLSQAAILGLSTALGFIDPVIGGGALVALEAANHAMKLAKQNADNNATDVGDQTTETEESTIQPATVREAPSHGKPPKDWSWLRQRGATVMHYTTAMACEGRRVGTVLRFENNQTDLRYRLLSVQIRGAMDATIGTVYDLVSLALVLDWRPTSVEVTMQDIFEGFNIEIEGSETAYWPMLPNRSNSSRFQVLKRDTWNVSGPSSTETSNFVVGNEMVDWMVFLPPNCIVKALQPETSVVRRPEILVACAGRDPQQGLISYTVFRGAIRINWCVW